MGYRRTVDKSRHVRPPVDQRYAAVERGIAELRRGAAVMLVAPGEASEAAIVIAAENAESAPALLSGNGADVAYVVPAGRAAALTLKNDGAANLAIVGKGAVRQAFDPELSLAIAGVAGVAPQSSSVSVSAADAVQDSAVELVKLARLLPAAVVAKIAGDAVAIAAHNDLMIVDADAVAEYRGMAERAALRLVTHATVPLEGAEDAEVFAYRPADGGKEHLAIMIGKPEPGQPVLTRIHSECFTGDLLGSLRCDCGEQLRGAIRTIAAAGSGILLYLAQEGRGIGLVNKLRAYRLQDAGFDTIDANERLGFEADERAYHPAAIILSDLGFKSIRLLTNNPAKVEGLSAFGIDVVERVPHAFPANGHNEQYLRTKAQRAGHIL